MDEAVYSQRAEPKLWTAQYISIFAKNLSVKTRTDVSYGNPVNNNGVRSIRKKGGSKDIGVQNR
jgi:hypothetical protein